MHNQFYPLTGPYQIQKSGLNDTWTCHRRSCDWKQIVNKELLKEGVKSLLRNMTTVTKYPHPFITSGIGEILGFVTANNTPFETDPHIIFGKDNNQGLLPDIKNNNQLLNRLELLGITALEILEEEMQSEDPDRRRKAAIDILSIIKNNPKTPLDE